MALSFSQTFAEPLAGILAKNVNTLLPLTRSGSCDRSSAGLLNSSSAASLFPNARDAAAALSGVFLLLGCWEESHNVSQNASSREGSYWHAIAHRIEPDSANSGYWFRRVGNHPIFKPLHQRAAEVLGAAQPARWALKPVWDPFLFIEWCDEARSTSDSAKKNIALEIQMAEWEFLFNWCAAGGAAAK